MKKIICFCFAAGFAFSTFAADISDLIKLRGLLKSYTQVEYSVTTKFGSYYRTPTLKITKNYKKDMVSEFLELSARDELLRKTENIYDAEGKLTEQNGTNKQGQLEFKRIITYKKGLKSDVSEYDAGGALKSKIIYGYSQTNLIDETSYDGDGVLTGKKTWTYTDDGKIKTACSYAADGSLILKQVYTYNENGILDGISYYDKDNREAYIETMRYDEKGLLAEITTYTNDRVSNRQLLKYDAGDNAARISRYNISEKFGTTVNELTSITEFTYSYDKMDPIVLESAVPETKTESVLSEAVTADTAEAAAAGEGASAASTAAPETPAANPVYAK